MSNKAVQGACFCLLVLTVVVSIDASPFARRDSDDDSLPEDCQNALLVCALPAIAPYIGLNETEIHAKIRNTPLSEHCSDFTTAGSCARKAIDGDACSEASQTSKSQLNNVMGVYDYSANYLCKDNFAKVDRNFKCLASQEVTSSIKSSCDTPSAESEDICSDITEYVDCSAGITETECGQEASTIPREFGRTIWDKVASLVKNVDCSASKRADRLSLIRRYLALV